MSNPQNPLSVFRTHQVYHVLGAFGTTSSAENTPLNKSSGEIGDSVGDGVIIVNEFNNDRFTIPTLVWNWSKGGYTGFTTTSMDGYIEIFDKTGGHFVDWFRTDLVKQFFNMSAQHMVFSLKTYFVGNNVVHGAVETVKGNPLIFHVHEISDTMNVEGTGTTIKMTFSTAYNTTAQMPNVSKPYQITLTHKEGGLENSSPETYNGAKGLLKRGVENSIKSELRKERLDKSKPMKTLKDVFEALEVSLNQQTSVHKLQVQNWLSEIRNDYIKKLKPPKQERGEKLPIEFSIKLDPIYNGYKINNRNLIFEQTEGEAKEPGVTTITFRAGSTISEIVDGIMKYSIDVGVDAEKGKLYRTNLSYSKTSEKIIINIKIKQITIAHNTVEVEDTGPGDGTVTGPLEFEFKSGDDTDILYLKTSILTDNGIKIIEDGEKGLPVLGNREPVMAERLPDTASGINYFKSGYSGLRFPIIPYLNTSIEDPVAGANIDAAHLINSIQPSTHEIQIIGNASLMFDLQRLPSNASELDSPGNAELYKIPESFPMYLKIKIYLKKDAVIGLGRADAADPPINPIYFYQQYYEIFGVSNTLINGSLYQNIFLKRSDDIV